MIKRSKVSAGCKHSNPIISVILCIVALIQVFPLYWMITLSLKSNQEVYGENLIGLPRNWEWDNYLTAVSRGNVGHYFLNSAIVTVATILFTLLLSAMVTFAIVRLKWRFSGVVYSIFLLGLMLSIQAVLLPLYVMLKGILNTYWALILPYVAFALPTSVLLMVGAMRDLPRELEEAAFIDGANVYRIFFHVVLPLLKPIMAAVAILTYLNTWNELMLAVTFVSGEEFKTLTVGINDLVGKYSTDWGVMGAGLTIATIPSVALFALLSNNIRKSLTLGAVKG